MKLNLRKKRVHIPLAEKYTPLKLMNAGKLNGLHFFLLLYLDEYAIFLNSSCRYSIDT